MISARRCCGAQPRSAPPLSAMAADQRMARDDARARAIRPAIPPPMRTEWIEVFHSKPSMRVCYLLEQQRDGSLAAPGAHNQLRDASHIRAGFRVLRLPFRALRFALSAGPASYNFV